jgi:hypothetical protein
VPSIRWPELTDSRGRLTGDDRPDEAGDRVWSGDDRWRGWLRIDRPFDAGDRIVVHRWR